VVMEVEVEVEVEGRQGQAEAEPQQAQVEVEAEAEDSQVQVQEEAALVVAAVQPSLFREQLVRLSLLIRPALSTKARSTQVTWACNTCCSATLDSPEQLSRPKPRIDLLAACPHATCATS
jgi:hypothetical protein